MKIAILQRILPDYRYELFKELSERSDINLTVLFGKSQKNGSVKNTRRNYSDFGMLLFTIPFLRKKFRVLHPTLLCHLVKINPDVIITEPSTYFPNNLVAFIYAKLFRKKYIWWESGLVESRSILRKLIEPFIKIIIMGSNSFIAYSSFARSYLINDYGISSNKIFVAQNTITNSYKKDIDIQNRIKKHLDIEEGSMVLLYIGSIDKRKKIEIIIDSLSLIKNKIVHLIIIGDGADLRHYIKYAESSKMGQIHFLGRKEIEEANHYLAISDFTILPAEGGLAINHSLSVGTPVICGKNDGTEKDLILEGFNGFIIDEITPKRIVETIGLTKFDKVKIKDHFISNYSTINMLLEITNAIKYEL